MWLRICRTSSGCGVSDGVTVWNNLYLISVQFWQSQFQPDIFTFLSNKRSLFHPSPLCPPARRSIKCILLCCLELYFTMLTGRDGGEEEKVRLGKYVFFLQNISEPGPSNRYAVSYLSSIWSDKREYYFAMMVLSTQERHSSNICKVVTSH